MIKVALLLGCLIATAAIIFAQDTPLTCKYETELWGSLDGTKFYFCYNDVVYERDCDPGTFFVRNTTVCGCLPYAYVDPQCIYAVPTAPTCTGIALTQPQPASSPTNYYLCTAEGASPIELTCPNGKAFVNQNGYLGCFAWDMWRNVRNCPFNED